MPANAGLSSAPAGVNPDPLQQLVACQPVHAAIVTPARSWGKPVNESPPFQKSLLPGLSWVEIELAAEEQDAYAIVLEAAEAPGVGLDRLIGQLAVGGINARRWFRRDSPQAQVRYGVSSPSKTRIRCCSPSALW